MNEKGVVSVTGEFSTCHSRWSSYPLISTDFLPRPRRDKSPNATAPKPLLPWLVRRIECIRGSLPIHVQCAPAFNYARSTHITSIIDDDSIPFEATQKKALFESDSLALDLRYVAEVTSASADSLAQPDVTLEFLDLSAKGHKGLAIQSTLTLREGQCVTFILRTPPTTLTHGPPDASPDLARVAEAGMAKVIVERKTLIGTTKGRAPDDPYLTKELLFSLLQVRPDKFRMHYIGYIDFTVDDKSVLV